MSSKKLDNAITLTFVSSITCIILPLFALFIIDSYVSCRNQYISINLTVGIGAVLMVVIICFYFLSGASSSVEYNTPELKVKILGPPAFFLVLFIYMGYSNPKESCPQHFSFGVTFFQKGNQKLSLNNNQVSFSIGESSQLPIEKKIENVSVEFTHVSSEYLNKGIRFFLKSNDYTLALPESLYLLEEDISYNIEVVSYFDCSLFKQLEKSATDSLSAYRTQINLIDTEIQEILSEESPKTNILSTKQDKRTLIQNKQLLMDNLHAEVFELLHSCNSSSEDRRKYNLIDLKLKKI